MSETMDEMSDEWSTYIGPFCLCKPFKFLNSWMHGEEGMENWCKKSWKYGGNWWNMSNLFPWEDLSIQHQVTDEEAIYHFSIEILVFISYFKTCKNVCNWFMSLLQVEVYLWVPDVLWSAYTKWEPPGEHLRPLKDSIEPFFTCFSAMFRRVSKSSKSLKFCQ